MKDILFRAKRIDNGKWVEGYYAYSGIVNRNFILILRGTCALPPHHWMFDNIEIDKNTLCQYTGLTDKNGNKIWENDIIGYWDTYSTENGRAEADCIGKVFWDDETLSFQVTERLSAESYEVMDECSVIGNIFDNPELLN